MRIIVHNIYLFLITMASCSVHGTIFAQNVNIVINELCEPEICNNGIDDDGNGLTDCEDRACAPFISDVTIELDVCEGSTGRIIVDAFGEELEYILDDGLPQQSKVFDQLEAGSYSVSAISLTTSCTYVYPFDIVIQASCEDCASGIDDDGDGDIDCEDSQCGVVVSNLEVLSASCDENAFDGIIRVDAEGRNLEYSLSGVYTDEFGLEQTYNHTTSESRFSDLYPGIYELYISNTVSGCSYQRSDLILNRGCEICDNDIDDDGDGYVDCDDIDCLLSRFINERDEPSLSFSDEKNNAKSSDNCVLLSEDELVLYNAIITASIELEEEFDILDGDFPSDDCYNSPNSYFMSPSGQLIDQSFLSSVFFTHPSKPSYSTMRYFVSGIKLKDGRYFKAITETVGIQFISGIPFISEHEEFYGYYQFDRLTDEFVRKNTDLPSYDLGNLIPLDVNIFRSGVHNAKVPVSLGLDCKLEVFCLENWTSTFRKFTDEVQNLISEQLEETTSRSYFIDRCSEPELLEDILIFSNGLRTSLSVLLDDKEEEVDRLEGGVWFFDRYNYWFWDGFFRSRLKPSTTLYVDGHNSISTSLHRDVSGFRKSICTFREYVDDVLPTGVCAIVNLSEDVGILNEPDNLKFSGELFDARWDNGVVTGEEIGRMILSGEIEVDFEEVDGITIVKQKIHIVAHSMGYTYSVGVIKGIKNIVNVKFGNYYILAAENPCGDSDNNAISFDDFDEVWQYGSRRSINSSYGLGNDNDDPIHEQDGVAVQCAVPEIVNFEDSNEGRYGRIYIPDQEVLNQDLEIKFTKNFLNSHFEDKYKWIFKIEKGNGGYVGKD